MIIRNLFHGCILTFIQFHYVSKYILFDKKHQTSRCNNIVQCFRGSVKCIFLGKIFIHPFFCIFSDKKKSLYSFFKEKGIN